MQAPELPSDRRKGDILRQTLKRRTPQERAAFLDGACGGDGALRAEMEALLAGKKENEGTVPPNAGVAALQLEEGSTQDMPMLLDQTPVTEGPGTVIGRYRLLEKIGEGGFGVVYVAEQREPVKRRVALKIIKLGMDTNQVVARFEAERQALALMDHPNIAKVLDAGATQAGRPYFVMGLVKGITITKYRDQEKLATRDRLDLFIKVCQAIQHAHQKGIIHRDIKPSNILVTLHDGVPVPKVIDFGIAKATQQELTEKTVYTQLQQFIGTPAYMSPEQAEMSGLDIDTRSDIYSLGVLLYELLTGSTPFDTKELMASGLDEMRKIIRERQPVRPSTRLTQQLRLAADPKIANRKSQIANDLDWIVMKCLEKDRTRRYDTANGLAMDLKRHLNNEPVLARPPSTAYRLQKAWRRNKLVFTAGVAVATALVVGIGVSTWQAVVAIRAKTEALQAKTKAVTAQMQAETSQQAEKEQRQRAEKGEAEARQNLYAAHMNLAFQAVQENNIGYALRLLDLHRPQPGQPDLRGWEWRYIWKLCQSDELMRLGSHSNTVLDAVFSPKGDVLATCSSDHTVKLWDITAQRETALLPHEGEVYAAAFSADGNRLATACADGNLRLWDVATRREISRVPVGNVAGPPNGGVAFSPGAEMLVLNKGADTLDLWDVPSGNQAACHRSRAEEIWVRDLFPERQDTRRWIG